MTAYEMQKGFMDFYQKEFSMGKICSPKILTNLGSQRLAFTLIYAIVEKDLKEYCEHLPKQRANG
jgi:hypothetical protein